MRIAHNNTQLHNKSFRNEFHALGAEILHAGNSPLTTCRGRPPRPRKAWARGCNPTDTYTITNFCSGKICTSFRIDLSSTTQFAELNSIQSLPRYSHPGIPTSTAPALPQVRTTANTHVEFSREQKISVVSKFAYRPQ